MASSPAVESVDHKKKKKQRKKRIKRLMVLAGSGEGRTTFTYSKPFSPAHSDCIKQLISLTVSK